VSAVNVLKSDYNYLMEILESFGWMVLGFVPTICALKIAWKVGVTKKYDVQKEQEKKVSANVP
jgi:hypothetical protein